MMTGQWVTKSEKETAKIAADLALDAVKEIGPVVILLEGELGAGKTTFARGFAAFLGLERKIKSPTFVLMKHYKFNYADAPKNNLYHLDCYRVRDHHDLATLGLEEIMSDPNNIVLIEWAERVAEILPSNAVKVHIDHVGDNERKIEIK